MQKKEFRVLGIVSLTIAGLVLVTGVSAAKEGVLEARVSTDNTVYKYNVAPVTITELGVINLSGAEIITQKGFSQQRFHLTLVFRDLQDREIVAKESTSYFSAPTAEMIEEDQDGDGRYDNVLAIERLPADWYRSYEPFSAADYYNLKPGRWTLSARIHTRIVAPANVFEYPAGSGKEYSSLEMKTGDWAGILYSSEVPVCIYDDYDGDGINFPACLPGEPEDCDDKNSAVYPGAAEIPGNSLDDDCDASTSDLTGLEGTIDVLANIHSVGKGPLPDAGKTPLVAPIRIFDKSPGSCVMSNYSASWQHYKSVWDYCPDIWNNKKSIVTTGGEAAISVPPGNYIMIAQYTEGADTIYIGRSIGDIAAGEVVEKYLQVIKKIDGQNLPTKNKILKGSLLLIIEPEYVEWDGEQELYPIVFDSIGDWEVSTAVSPPEGFVADYEQLSEQVTSEVEAVQFTITDIGSEWVSTGVDYQVKHNGKTKKLKSSIGIKCSKKLGKKKEFDEFCKDIRKK